MAFIAERLYIPCWCSQCQSGSPCPYGREMHNRREAAKLAEAKRWTDWLKSEADERQRLIDLKTFQDLTKDVRGPRSAPVPNGKVDATLVIERLEQIMDHIRDCINPIGTLKHNAIAEICNLIADVERLATPQATVADLEPATLIAHPQATLDLAALAKAVGGDWQICVTIKILPSGE